MPKVDRLKYRLYAFVPYNISEIQKGIQAGHAALEYAFLYGETDEYKSFIVNDKTWIILNGGTTRAANNIANIGSLNQIDLSLWDNDIPCSKFFEPDLNVALTAVCFLADERVWDFENYPDFENTLWEEAVRRSFFGDHKRSLESLIEKYPEAYQTWVTDIMGGEKNAFLRELIRNKKLA